MAQFLYSGPSGDQYEAFKKEYYEKAEAAKAAEEAAEVVEVTKEVEAEVAPKTASKK